ncbi:hypothetical protein ONZ45_g18919 [Pleurotus djamor]|nr:hypothetical protein ONZ45_g18919 [Pleurotus djamor]
MTHTLQTLEEFCAELEQRTRNNTLEDEELPAIRFHVFTATVLTLRSFVTDATRLASLAEVPNSSKILLAALAVAYEHLPSDRDSRRTLLRLLTHARSIPLRGERKYKTTQIKDWAKTFGNEFPATLQTSFGNPLLQSQSTRGLVVDMCFSANTKSPYGVTLTISDTEENKTSIYSWDTSSERSPNEVMSFPCLHARVSPDGSLVAVFSQDVIRVLNVKLDSDELQTTPITETTDNSEQGQADDQASLWFSDDNALLANCHQRQIDLWHRVGSGDEWEASDASDTFEVTNPVKSCLTFLSDNTKLAFINAESSISVLNLMSEDKEPFVLERSSDASVLTKSPSGEWLVSGHPHVVKVWSVESMTLFHNFLCDPSISSLAFRPDGQVLATGGEETIKLWNSNTWQWFQAFNGGGMVTALTFSSDGSRLASASDVNGVSNVRLWDAEVDVESLGIDEYDIMPNTKDVLNDLGVTPRDLDTLYDT